MSGIWLLICLGLALVVAMAVMVYQYLHIVRLQRDNNNLRHQLATRHERPAIISHEIRTPLALINGAAELLAEGLAGS